MDMCRTSVVLKYKGFTVNCQFINNNHNLVITENSNHDKYENSYDNNDYNNKDDNDNQDYSNVSNNCSGNNKNGNNEKINDYS